MQPLQHIGRLGCYPSGKSPQCCGVRRQAQCLMPFHLFPSTRLGHLRERAGDRAALPLPAAERVRGPLRDIGQADRGQRGRHLRARGLRRQGVPAGSRDVNSGHSKLRVADDRRRSACPAYRTCAAQQKTWVIQPSSLVGNKCAIPAVRVYASDAVTKHSKSLPTLPCTLKRKPARVRPAVQPSAVGPPLPSTRV